MDTREPTDTASFITSERLADFLGVSIDSLKKWRLQASAKSPLYLPANGPKQGMQATYLFEDVAAFVVRNDEYRDRILAAFAPVEIANRLLPMAYQISQLRGTPEEAVIGRGLLGGFEEMAPMEQPS